MDIDGFQWPNNGGTLEISVDPAAVTPTSLAWDTAEGGVDLDSASTDPVPISVPFSFYWSQNPAFNAGQDTLASTSIFEAGQKPSTIQIDPSALTTPPEGTGYLLAVLDPNHTVLPQGTGNTLSLAYDPNITVTGEYDGSSDPAVIGRFLAKPGLASERFIVKLSPSLAALRPEVITFINDGESLEASPEVVGLGWDGETYETGGFDPETLEPDSSFSVLFKAVAGGELSNQPLYTGSQILTVACVPFKLGYGLDENVNYTLDADVDVSFSPDSGFSL